MEPLDIAPDQVQQKKLEELTAQTLEFVKYGAGFSPTRDVQSPNYIPGLKGWIIRTNGEAEFQGVTVAGVVLTTAGTFGGDGSDGALNVPSGTTTINLGGAQYVTKNYTTINIAAGATLAFSNPHANGTYIVLKSQGAVTIIGTLNAKGTGTAGGAGSNSGGAATNGTDIPLTWLIYNTVATGGGKGANGTSPASPASDGGTAAINQNYYGFDRRAVTLGADRLPVLLVPGAGGGGGSSNNGASGTGAGNGGNGGAALYIECGGALNFTGTINISGANGTDSNNASFGVGGGGGGGAGTMLLLYNTLTANSGTVTNVGGNGGVRGGGGTTGTAYGGGGGGSLSATTGSDGQRVNPGTGGAGAPAISNAALILKNVSNA